jgi:hypothetical protein
LGSDWTPLVAASIDLSLEDISAFVWIFEEVHKMTPTGALWVLYLYTNEGRLVVN